MKRIIAFILLLGVILNPIPSKAVIQVECINCDWMDWEYEPNFRTMIVLDVVINVNLNEEQRADYRPTKDISWIRNFDYTSLADMQVYTHFDEGENPAREPVMKLTDDNDDYAFKLQRLINENVMTRDSVYKLTRYYSNVSHSDDMYWSEQ